MSKITGVFPDKFLVVLVVVEEELILGISWSLTKVFIVLVLKIVLVVSFVVRGVEEILVSAVSVVSAVSAVSWEVGATEFETTDGVEERAEAADDDTALTAVLAASAASLAAEANVELKFERLAEADLTEFFEDNDFAGDDFDGEELVEVFVLVECKLETDFEDFIEDFDFDFSLSWWSWWVNFFVCFFISPLTINK